MSYISRKTGGVRETEIEWKGMGRGGERRLEEKADESLSDPGQFHLQFCLLKNVEDEKSSLTGPLRTSIQLASTKYLV